MPADHGFLPLDSASLASRSSISSGISDSTGNSGRAPTAIRMSRALQVFAMAFARASSFFLCKESAPIGHTDNGLSRLMFLYHFNKVHISNSAVHGDSQGLSTFSSRLRGMEEPQSHMSERTISLASLYPVPVVAKKAASPNTSSLYPSRSEALLQDIIAALISIFLIEPLQANITERLAEAGFSAQAAGRVASCFSDAAPGILDRAGNDPAWAIGHAVGYWTGVSTVDDILNDAAPNCLIALEEPEASAADV